VNARKITLLAGSCVLAFSVLACTINVGGPVYPTPAVPVSTQAVEELTQAIQTAVAAGVESGEITLVITETELTSYLNYELGAQAEPFITNPQVYLRDGQIRIYGTARQGYFVATAGIILTAGIDTQGRLKLELTSADFGPLPVPSTLKDAITAAIQEAYTGPLGPVATGFRLESITVADGAMTIVGKIK
jgi:hypothetical protein